jgi:hypothetical protein
MQKAYRRILTLDKRKVYLVLRPNPFLGSTPMFSDNYPNYKIFEEILQLDQKIEPILVKLPYRSNVPI